MRGCLKIAALAIGLPLIVFVGLAFWALRHKLPTEPQLPGRVLYGVYGNRGLVHSAQASIDYFLRLDGLGGPPARAQLPDIDQNDGSTAERQRWTAPGKRNVTLIRIQGGGHSLPHPATQGMRLLGSSNRDVHAANEIWDFFQQAP